MASFSAELHVAGVVIPLIRCTYGTHQSTDARGRVITKARKSPIDCEADVPEHQVLDAWAADAHQRQEATIIFRNAATGVAWETLHLPAAYCVSYTEVFVMGDVTSGSYRCFFTLSDPDGWIWYPGSLPDETAIRPAAREHGAPPVATLGGAVAGAAAEPGPRKLVFPADVPPHLPAPEPIPSPDHAQVYVSQAEWAALIQNRWERNEASKKKKFTFLQPHRQTEFHVAGDPLTYRVGADGKMAAVYDAQTRKSYNITGTRKGLLRIPLTLDGEPTYAGTEHMMSVTGNQKNVVVIKMTGNRDGDFRTANEAAGLSDLVASQGRRPERPPKGYAWHHRDDFTPTTGTPPPYGTCTMELVDEEAHAGTFVHFGSCDQCNKHTGITLYE